MREQYQARLVAWNPANIRNTGCLGNLKTFKNSGRGWDSLYCKKVKVKVSLFTFNFCCVNCCNTSQLLLLTGSRLLKLLLTTKCISTRIFVCLFLFNFLLLKKTIPTSSCLISQDDTVDTPASPQLSSWLVGASCTEVLQRPASSLFLVFLDFAKDLRKWSRVFSAPCMEMVKSSEWWKDCKLRKVVIGEQGNQIDAQSR